MISAFANTMKVPELRSRILFTLARIVIVRLGVHLPLPGVDVGELARCIAYIDQSAQSTGNRNHWQDWALILRRCSREQWGIRQEKPVPKKQDETIGWHGAAYDEEECTPEEKAAAAADFERMKAYLAKLKARG